MKILIADDEDLAATAAMRELERLDSGAVEVDHAASPMEAITRLTRTSYDVVVVDMLFLPLVDDFERRRREGTVRLTDGRLHVSGLAVLHALQKIQATARPVLWTSGESNRLLQMAFADEVLDCRVMCSKTKLSDLVPAVEAALAGTNFLSTRLVMTLSRARPKPLTQTLLANSTRLNILRAMAVGIHHQKEVAATLGVAYKTVRNYMSGMHELIEEVAPGYTTSGQPGSAVSRFSVDNWEFFLDDTVRTMFP